VGECTETSAVVWYRDEDGLRKPPTLLYWKESEQTEKFVVAVAIVRDADYTSKTRLENLIPNTRYRYTIGEREGTFKTPGSAACSFVFGACIGGQGYGRNITDTNAGGFPIFSKILELKPDFFLMEGDSIYADNSIYQVSPNPFFKGLKFFTNGLDYIPVADNLQAMRDRYKYHLEDEIYSRFLRSCSVSITWDDHEVVDNFGQTKLRQRGKGQLFDDGLRAFLEYWPIVGPPQEPLRIYKKFSWGPHIEVFVLDTRSYRDVHELRGSDTTPSMRFLLGETQLQWLLDSLKESTSTWKCIALSVPISYPTGWPSPDVDGYDGFSDGNWDHVGGPEVELLKIFEHIRDHNIRNVLFLSGDVHFPFVLSYDPFLSGKPLAYELSVSPFHALCLPPPLSGPDNTFNPTIMFTGGSFGGNSFNFGHAVVSSDGEFDFSVRNLDGQSIYNLVLQPDDEEICNRTKE
jgi:alkaline phosphatase D